MKIRQNAQISAKHKLSNTLKSWLPILQANISDLNQTIDEFTNTNPYMEVKSGFEKSFADFSKKNLFLRTSKNSITEKIEALSLASKSLYDVLYEQIESKLFPTIHSQNIAKKIIDYINEDGYFDGDSLEVALECGVSVEEFEKVRARFAYLEPSGIGARDARESFLFQLEQVLDISDEVYSLVKKIINSLDDLKELKKEPYFEEAMSVIKRFNNPPSMEYLSNDDNVVPDIFVYEEDGTIEVKINDSYYPEIIINSEDVKSSDEFIKNKIKEAKSLVDALQMRKATLYKIGLMIVEYQYEFFMGGDIKPMRLKDLADEFGHVPSTISRAISNKYLECNRGVIPIKNFFTTAIDEELSNASIKDFVQKLIENENHKKPLSDLKIVELVEAKFKIQMVRRTITKYRKQLNIPTSSERKKFYELGN